MKAFLWCVPCSYYYSPGLESWCKVAWSNWGIYSGRKLVFLWLLIFCTLTPSETLNYTVSLVKNYLIAGNKLLRSILLSVTCSCLTENWKLCSLLLIIPYPFIRSHNSLVVSDQHCRISYKCWILRTDDLPISLKGKSHWFDFCVLY